MQRRKGRLGLGGIAVILPFLVISSLASASVGARDASKVGIFTGLLGEPFPSVWGVNAAFNALGFLRLSAGVGFTNVSLTDLTGTTTLDAKTYSGEAKLLVPGWNLSPALLGGYSYVRATITGTGSNSFSELGGLSGSGGSPYAGAGIDWQTDLGLNVGFDYKVLLQSGGGALPGFYMGWYF